MAAARLTLRLALHGPDSKIDDPNNLFERIDNLLAAYVNSEDGKEDADERPSATLLAFASAVAMTIADAPSLRAAVAAHLATTQDNDP
jgi:hypothetical protein